MMLLCYYIFPFAGFVMVWSICTVFLKPPWIFIPARRNAYCLQQATCQMTSVFKTLFKPTTLLVLLERL